MKNAYLVCLESAEKIVVHSDSILIDDDGDIFFDNAGDPDQVFVAYFAKDKVQYVMVMQEPKE